MKFGAHLSLVIASIPEWSSRFVQYRELKRTIKRIKVARAEQRVDESHPLLGRARTGSYHAIGSFSVSKKTRSQSDPADKGDKGDKGDKNTANEDGSDDESELSMDHPYFYDEEVEHFGELIGANCRMVADFYGSTIEEYRAYLAQDLEKGSKKGKHTVQLIYQRLETLKTYLTTNKLAVKKIVKKFNKNVEKSDKMDADKLTQDWSTQELDPLEEQCEEIFAQVACQGNLVEAKRILRTRSIFKFTHFDAFLFGIFAGWVFPLLWYMSHKFKSKSDSSSLETLVMLPMWRLACCIMVYVWAWGVCLHVFERNQINHIYILGLNPARHLSWLQCLQVAAGLTVLFLVAMLSGSHVLHHKAYEAPLFFFGCMLVILFWPFSGFFRATRRRFLRVLRSIVLLPFGGVGFLEFFVADQLTSMSNCIADVLYMSCFYTSTFLYGHDSQGHSGCYDITNRNKFMFTFIPYFWRLMQCLIMYRTTRNRNHLINAGKYIMFITVVFLGAGWIHGISPRWMLVLASIAAESYALAWDFLMDWGFVRGRSRQLMYSWTWIYPLIVGLDILGRFMFLSTKSQGAVVPLLEDEALLICILAPLEIIRRNIWNILRVESEMCNNLESYRSIAFVPSPIAEIHKADRTL